MSMTATFVQVDAAELSRIKTNPYLAESLFMGGHPAARATAMLTESTAFQDRVRASGPQMLAKALEQLDPAMRERLEARLGGANLTGEQVLKLMSDRAIIAKSAPAPKRSTLSLDKAWHGVHYLLCGTAEPGPAPLSQAVMGGHDIGDDEEGFSGYGPARYFTPEQVAKLSESLSRPGLEAEAESRFDAEKMMELDIYPGWEDSDKEWVMESLRSLRSFYADAAAQGQGIVTCLI